MRPAICLLSLLVAAPVALSQATEADRSTNIAGLWAFEAELPDPCSFTGQARLVASGEPGRYRCELTAQQHCPSIDVTYVVEQSCSVTQDGDSVTVQSTIVNFLEGEPTPNYTPDHFQMDIETPASMSGVLIGSSIYPAIWHRASDAIS